MTERREIRVVPGLACELRLIRLDSQGHGYELLKVEHGATIEVVEDAWREVELDDSLSPPWAWGGPWRDPYTWDVVRPDDVDKRSRLAPKRAAVARERYAQVRAATRAADSQLGSGA